jgi:lysophospholipase L1-like esterase
MTKEQILAAIEQADGTSVYEVSGNLLNVNNTNVIKGHYLASDGSLGSGTNYCISDKISVSFGETYCVTSHDQIINGTLGIVYDKDGNKLTNISGSLNDDGTAYAFTIINEEAAYIKVNFYYTVKNTYMVVKGDTYPDEYIPFWKALTDDFSLNEKQKGDVKEVIKSEIKEYRSANLFNHRDVEEGYYLKNYDGGKVAHKQNSIAYIRLDGAGNYVTRVNSGLFGNTANSLPLYDENKNYIGRAQGTLLDAEFSDAAGLSIEINLEGAYYVGLTVLTSIKDQIMFVKGTEYPAEYIPFDEYVHIEKFRVTEADNLQSNPLHLKKISLNGDSICAGAGYTGGYGKIIADRNNMVYQNIGVGGGTIVGDTYTEAGAARHWISRTIENMDADADYAILEGGVNDASLLVTMGAITPDFKTALDDTTFCGAFESMLKKLVTRFAGKKIGYIAVHKMTDKYRSDNADDGTSYYWAAKKCCEKWGVPFLDLNTTVPAFAFFKYNTTDDLKQLMTTYTHNGDGWHPNEEGYKKYYCDKIEAWLKTL